MLKLSQKVESHGSWYPGSPGQAPVDAGGEPADGEGVAGVVGGVGVTGAGGDGFPSFPELSGIQAVLSGSTSFRNEGILD